MVLYSCSVCLTIGFVPVFSIRLYLACLQCLTDGRPFCSGLSFSLLFPLPLSLSLSIYFLLRVFPFFRRVSVFLNFYLPLGFSRSLSSPFSLANTGILYIFRELLFSYFINIVVRVYLRASWAKGGLSCTNE